MPIILLLIKYQFTYQYQLGCIFIFICSIFFGVIASIDFILLFILFPAVLLPFVGVLVIRLRIGVKFYNFNAFSEYSFFSFEELFIFINSNPSISGFLPIVVKFVVDKFYLSSWKDSRLFIFSGCSFINLCSNAWSHPILSS